MNKIALAVVFSLLAGFAIGAWFSGDEAPDNRAVELAAPGALPDDASAEDRLLRLEQIIGEEREARIALEDTLAMLFEEIERLEGAGGLAAAERLAEEQRQREARATERRSPRDRADWLQNYQERRVGRMVAGGFSEDEARRILEQESEASYKALLAAWEAQRNGENIDPIGSMNNPQSILRGEIGDDAYARYLEAQGQPTSITITQVLSGSPGSSVGLQAGDQLVSYDGERIFNVVDLRDQTLQGNPGETVVIEVDRDGTRMQLTIPRGPIGLTGSGANIRGMNWWGG